MASCICCFLCSVLYFSVCVDIKKQQIDIIFNGKNVNERLLSQFKNTGNTEYKNT